VTENVHFAAADIAVVCGGEWLHAPTRAIERFHFDSREVSDGNCFVALKTGARDGHDFIAAAQANGAVAALVSEPQPELSLPQLCVADTLQALQAIAADHRQQFSHPLAAITGSFGKTSTKEMLSCMLGESVTATTPGNWNNHIGVPLSLLQINPNCHRYAVIEAGISEPGEMPPLGKLARATHVLFTGIGPAHLEALGDEAGVAREKFALAEYADDNATLFFPYECLAHEVFRQTGRPCQVLVKEGTPVNQQILPAKFQLSRYSSQADGKGARVVSLKLNASSSLTFTLTSDSEGMAGNAALAALAAHAMGADSVQITTGAGHWQADSKRGRWLTDKNGSRWFIDCYNANPTAMRDSLNTFIRATGSIGGKRLFVLGSMLELGSRAVELHEAALAECHFDSNDAFLLIGEDALRKAYAKAIVERGGSSAHIEYADKTPTALPAPLATADCVFLKGSRSHRLEQLLIAPS
jgi:UDP-N-acetylmuramoyl-tripeptide--D-alanyl-D-alanine ligase